MMLRAGDASQNVAFLFLWRISSKWIIGICFSKPPGLPLAFTQDSINVSDCGVWRPIGERIELGGWREESERGAGNVWEPSGDPDLPSSVTATFRGWLLAIGY